MAISVTSVPFSGAGILTSGCQDLWFSQVDIPTTPYVPQTTTPGDPGARTPGDDSSRKQPSGDPLGSGAGRYGSGGEYGPTNSGQQSYGGGGEYGSGGTGSSGGGGGGGYSDTGGSGGPIPTDPSVGNIPVGAPITREQILARARFWAGMSVPYSMAAYTNDPQGKSYRTDCSGLVSMALKLETSLSTVTLPSQVVPIGKEDLLPGDIVGNLGGGTGGASGHVMIFARWADEAHTTFFTVEETPPKAVERTRVWGSAPYASHAFRYRNLVG